ncbi:MAG: lysylphosphatidylglycerol synthase domain-containing protein [Candidatus Saccharimonadales bacterium]
MNISQLKKSFSIPKRTLSILIILATLLSVVYYFYKHHSLVSDLKNITPYVFIEVLALYALMLVVLALIFKATMRLARVDIHSKENYLINAYSLFMNFFIPGQTGPAYRGYYMKKNHKLKYLDYSLATALYYMVYGLLSVGFVVAGSQPYYFSLPIILVAVLAGYIVIKLYISKKGDNSRLNLGLKNVMFIIFATLCQVVLQAIIYFIEIHNTKSQVHVSQIITYTGTANLALFVALTPGAIGIREGFLILTEKLNHISSSTIVLANVVDRSVYIIYLLIIGLAIVSLKIKSQLSAMAKPS